MIPTNNDVYTLELYKRVSNSAYEYENAPKCRFKGHPASKVEKKSYRITKGVNGDDTSTFVSCTNLPSDVDIGDRVKFMGKEYSVQSIGYLYELANIYNADLLSEEQIIARCPKGLNLQ